MESGLLLDIVVGQGTSILQLLTSEDQTLLIWGNAFFVLKNSVKVLFNKFQFYLDLGLDIFNSVTRLHLKGDSLPCQGLHEDLHGRNLDLLQKPHLFSLTIQHISRDKYIQTL